MKIVISFFGITRSLSFTLPSIQENVLNAARSLGDVSLLGHFFEQSTIVNARSGESGCFDIEEYKLLGLDSVQLEKPDIFLDSIEYDEICRHGDSWGDDFKSLKNLMHQLYSLRSVTRHALMERADVYLFCRPDLHYWDDFGPVIRKAAVQQAATSYVPFWQWHGGLNDRFCICSGPEAAAAFGLRFDDIKDFLTLYDRPLHSEKLLEYSLSKRHIKVRPVMLRASRVRVDGIKKDENFSPWHGMGLKGAVRAASTIIRSI